MPIEPTNVSKPSIREVEPSSPIFGSWTSMQGSSSGGKDSPLNSIWEKAINGAQKLFGSSSVAAALEDASEAESSADRLARDAVMETDRDIGLGFDARRFGRFGGAAFGGNTFGSIATSRSAPRESSASTFETSIATSPTGEKHQPEWGPKESTASAIAEKNDGSETAAKTVRRVEDNEPLKDDVEEEKASVENSRVLPAAPVLHRGVVADESASASIEASVQTSSRLSQQAAEPTARVEPRPVPVAIAAQTLTPSQTPVGQNSQVNVASPSSKQPVITPAPVVAETSKPLAATAVASSAKGGPAQVPAQPEAAGEKPAAAVGVVPAVAVGIKKIDTPLSVSPGDVQAAQSKPISDAAPKGEGVLKDGLGLDVAKAKEALSESLAQTVGGRASARAQPAASTPAQHPAAVPVEARDAAPRTFASEGANLRVAESGLPDGKDPSLGDASKRDLAGAGLQRAAPAKGMAESASQAGSGVTAAERLAADTKGAPSGPGNASPTGQFSREAAAAAASRIQSPVKGGNGPVVSGTEAATSGVNGLSGGQGLATGGTLLGAQQGNSQGKEGDPYAKQDFASSLKQEVAAKAGGKLPDGSQSFDAKVDEAAGSRRSEAAGKARQTSYVSKTAEEVKEVVATLTKSIDRLVTDKSGVMKLKINFEGGGSVNLKISMDGSQVSTQMQTDVVGLEGAIKANWAEFASDWNQKGVKLSTPQFQNSEGSKDSSFDDLTEFASKEDRQSEARRRASQAARSRGFGSSAAEDAAAPSAAQSSSEEVAPDRELKTYA